MPIPSTSKLRLRPNLNLNLHLPIPSLRLPFTKPINHIPKPPRRKNIKPLQLLLRIPNPMLRIPGNKQHTSLPRSPHPPINKHIPLPLGDVVDLGLGVAVFAQVLGLGGGVAKPAQRSLGFGGGEEGAPGYDAGGGGGKDSGGREDIEDAMRMTGEVFGDDMLTF
ncbi:hypothetical protein BJX70DRAFT_399959 [Aspergillus crustosus]